MAAKKNSEDQIWQKDLVQEENNRHGNQIINSRVRDLVHKERWSIITNQIWSENSEDQ